MTHTFNQQPKGSCNHISNCLLHTYSRHQQQNLVAPSPSTHSHASSSLMHSPPISFKSLHHLSIFPIGCGWKQKVGRVMFSGKSSFCFTMHMLLAIMNPGQISHAFSPRAHAAAPCFETYLPSPPVMHINSKTVDKQSRHTI